jgi:hypothetical protein
MAVPMPRAKVNRVPHSPEAVRAAVEKALPILWTGLEGHSVSRDCFTCHNHAVPMVAFATARDRGFAVDEKRLAEAVTFVIDDLERNRDNFARGRGPGPPPAGGEADNTAYSLFALEVLGYKPDKATEITARYTAGFGRSRGYWFTPAGRVPTEASSFTTTALALRGILKYAAEEHTELVRERAEASLKWMLKTAPRDTEDRVFRLIGLKAAGADAAEVEKAAKDLAATQQPDGGWAQTDAMTSDAYATGTALYALHTAGGVPTTDPAYRRGIEFLLGTQRGDGSWHVRTRSRPVQRYFETGFPYEKDQFISCAATGWAAAALALDCPKK